MKILLISFLLSTYFLHSQTLVKRGNQIYLGETRQNIKEVKGVLEKDSVALRLFHKAQNKKSLAALLIIPGGAMIGYEIGRFTSTGAVGNSRQLLAGWLASLVGILVSRGLDKRYKEAFDEYNSRQAPKSTKKVSLVGSNQGLGIQIRF